MRALLTGTLAALLLAPQGPAVRKAERFTAIMSAGPLTPQPTSIDIGVDIVALTLDARDHGTGMIFHTARITFGKDGPDLVSELSGQPTKLLSVQKVR